MDRGLLSARGMLLSVQNRLHMRLSRREFLRLTGSGVFAASVAGASRAVEEEAMAEERTFRRLLSPEGMVGGLRREEGPTPLPQAVWYVAEEPMGGLSYRFPTGSLAEARFLTADLLLDGNTLSVFALELREGEEGPSFHLAFAALNQCQARLRFALEGVNQNRWRYDREGAWLKPMCGGDRVDLRRVDRMSIVVFRKSDKAARFCLTPVVATAEEPELVSDPVLPRGPLLDELGQSRLHEWPGRSGRAEEVTERLRGQLAEAGSHRPPEGRTRWGGLEALRFEATGFFRTHHDGRRWWLVDPDGCGFWSAGVDCVRVDTEAAYAGLEKALSWLPDREGRYRDIYSNPEGERRTINYLKANLMRAFGSDEWYEQWSRIALAELRRLGFNTVGNWSDWGIAREAGFPYVRPLELRLERTPLVYRDFPDVFDARFEEEAEAFADQLVETREDPALIGYFLMNEPTWGFAEEAPAAGMLFNTPACHCRRALASFLRERRGDDAGLSAAWGMEVTLSEVAEGQWRKPLTEGAEGDLEAFSTVMVGKLFGGLSEACRRADPNHLNLGARYYTAPPRWALDGMRCFDVFSVNCYHERVRPELAELSAYVGRPVMVGEWHFGALDVGLPASGIGHVRDQEARGQAYRVYLEDAASKPWCVGVHYFTLYDQSALGRFDGENYNIGFLDVCNRPYGPLARAARAGHERLYRVALGEVEPYADAPEYLPLLFM